MRESVPARLLIQLCQASPETLAAVQRLLTSTAAMTPSKPGGKGGPAWVFRWTGRDWKVVFDGGEPFYLPDTLGAPYLDYLLHRPNEPISAFELEVAVSPEKGEARATNSIQAESDARALAQYREELRRLQAKRKELETTADADGLEHLDNEVAVLAAALNAGRGANDTGERARSNVRLAVRSVKARLEKQGQEEREFAEHLRTHLSLGYECLYRQPAGRIWD